MNLARPFPLRDVSLNPGVQSRAQRQMLHLARVYPVDRLLAVFRANAGLDTKGAEPPGNWEDFGHPDEQPWSGADYPGAGAAPTASLLRGHYAGHFLSMLAMAHASTGDPLLKHRSDELVAGLAEVQRALAATGRFSHPGFLAAYGEWQFDRLEHLAPYGEIWAPWYTCHKIMAGLLDAHTHTGSQQALDVVTAMGHWASARMRKVDRKQVQRMWSLYIAGEYGGMNESLVRLFRVTGEKSFLETSFVFEMDDWLRDAVAGRDVLDGMHANQHLPMLAGHLEQYEVTGEQRYLDAVLHLWHQIVPGRTFAHGGTGEGELWGPPGAVAGFIGRRNAETCATYNLLKIARGLFTHTLDVRFADYAERAGLNHVVGSRADVLSDTGPEVVYMYPVDPGAVREYGNVGTCCGGTGLESQVKHQESVFFEVPGAEHAELYLLQYVPSTLTWAEAAGTVTVDTRYPREGTVRLLLDVTGSYTLHLRIPPWARGRQRVSVNGQALPAVDLDGFVTLRRTFTPGDVVQLVLPLPLRLVPTPDDPSLVSLEQGPTVLLARDDSTTTLNVSAAGSRLLDGSIDASSLDPGSLDPGSIEASGVVGGDLVHVLGHTFEPAWSGGEHRYHLYLRLSEHRIVFRGSDPGVANRHDQDGWSFLGALWAGGGFATVEDFFTAVHRHALRAARAGLLSRSEVIAVLHAAAASTLDEPDGPRESAVHPGPGSVSVGQGRVVWHLPDDAGQEHPAPVIRFDVTGERAPSGWYTTPPSFTVTVVSPGPGVTAVEYETGDHVWHPLPATGGVPLTTDGRHPLRARAVDVTGRTVHAAHEVAVDTEPPAPGIRVRPLGDDSVEITLDATDDVSGVDRVQWRTAETFWGVYQEPFTRALRDEPQTLEYTATDRAGNVTPVRTVTLPPTAGRSKPSATW
ncbi:glycoside hydrolase family 127 protein [Kineosporia sp. J2-2]|uniref:Glycoside hydrolase family 127 protein n=1 Tax=Kineosporia corallincola TaxID=2835133 RepID=A0ABS5TMD8_9ACTN|nr:beta-L-arabinofuranosidase domain-containing protein [Kineosporia corallincola]MBT0771539.1 glycoside hydrolase family 127 protein [Kineosporia corallincola]